MLQPQPPAAYFFHKYLYFLHLYLYLCFVLLSGIHSATTASHQKHSQVLQKKFKKFIIVLKDPRLHCKEEWVSGNNGPTIVRVARMGFGCIIEQGRMHDFPDAGGRTDLVHRPLCVLKWGSKN